VQFNDTAEEGLPADLRSCVLRCSLWHHSGELGLHVEHAQRSNLTILILL